VESVSGLIESLREPIEAGLSRTALQEALPAGAARNALDCALWDLEAKLTGVPAHVAAGIDRLAPVTTAYTISLDTPEAMAEATARAAFRPILKIKLGAPDGDLERIAAVRAAAPDATLIADANEGWTEANLADHLAACAAAGFALIEQPVPADRDAILTGRPRDVMICADESLHDRHGLPGLVGRYDAINIKLDKAGGLTEALALADEAQRLGFSIMIGCMLGTSLAMAPGMLIAPKARFVDLDGPLLLASERQNGLRYDGSTVYPPASSLWG
jgi:L-alanine-DL-glutamate epimerase-like enolase superfamily enzyme